VASMARGSYLARRLRSLRRCFGSRMLPAAKRSQPAYLSMKAADAAGKPTNIV
jgi:hypothetical protein